MGGTRKYLLYAIGEIALVMIGILLALQVNNWNQDRLDRITEKEVLANLHKEFQLNRNEISLTRNAIENCSNATLTLMNYFGQERKAIEQYNIDSLLFYTLETRPFAPSQYVLSDLVQSGKLQHLTNDKLKELLFQWTNLLQIAQNGYFEIEEHVRNHLLTYLYDHYSLRNIDMYDSLNWKNPTTLVLDEMLIFHDMKFENLLDDMLYKLVIYFNQLQSAEEIIEAILEESPE